MEKTFVGLLTKDGKKERAQNIFYTSVSRVAKKNRVPVYKLLETIFDKIEPILNYSISKRGASAFAYPKRMSPWRARSMSVKWIVESAKARSEKGFVLKFEGELNDLFKGKSKSLSRRLEFQKRAVSNRFILRKFWIRKSKYYYINSSVRTAKISRRLSKFGSQILKFL